MSSPIVLRLASGAGQAVTGTTAHPADLTELHSVTVDKGTSIELLDDGVVFDKIEAPADASNSRDWTKAHAIDPGPFTVTIVGNNATIYFGHD